MNPLNDLIEVPANQFLLLYCMLAFFAALFLIYVRWECAQVEQAAKDPELTPDEIGFLAHGPSWAAHPAAVASLRLRLAEAGLLVSPSAFRRAQIVAGLVTSIFVALACIKIPMNLARNRSIVGLVIALAVTLVGGFVLGLRPLGLTSRGANLLDRLRAAGRVPEHRTL